MAPSRVVPRCKALLQLCSAYLSLIILSCKIAKKKKCARQKPRWWVRPQWQNRRKEGEFHTALNVMYLLDQESFKKYYRVTPAQFDELCNMLEKYKQQKSSPREGICARQCLAMTLRYLASGDAIKSISLAFRVGFETARRSIHETCTVLYDALHNDYLPIPTHETWAQSAKEFSTLWNFPNCIGAVDGKHVVMQCPRNTGSLYYNYKGTFSIVLMAVADANYRFTYIDVGGFGKQSDGGTFQVSSLGRALISRGLDIPVPSTLPDSSRVCPHVFLGDEAFQMTENFLRPYPGKSLDCDKRIFNFRLSRARRCVENAFGVLASRWRIFRRPINLTPTNTINVVRATIVLHNYLRDIDVMSRTRDYCAPDFVDREDRYGNVLPGLWRTELESNPADGLHDVTVTSAKNYSESAQCVKNNFKQYFVEEGSVPWQYAIPGARVL